jgi:hypothetical protein
VLLNHEQKSRFNNRPFPLSVHIEPIDSAPFTVKPRVVLQEIFLTELGQGPREAKSYVYAEGLWLEDLRNSFRAPPRDAPQSPGMFAGYHSAQRQQLIILPQYMIEVFEKLNSKDSLPGFPFFFFQRTDVA